MNPPSFKHALLEALRMLQDADEGVRTDPDHRSRHSADLMAARGRLMRLVQPPLLRFLSPRVPNVQEREELVSTIALGMLRGAPRCYATDRARYPRDEEAADAAQAWFRRLAMNRLFSHYSEHYGRRTMQRELEHLETSSFHRPVDALEALELKRRRASLAAAEESVYYLVRHRFPGELWEDARKDGIGSREPIVRQNVHVWTRVHLRGERTLQVGRALAYPGDDKRVETRVSAQVRRGRLGMQFGALTAVVFIGLAQSGRSQEAPAPPPEVDPRLEGDLLDLERALSQPMRGSGTEAEGTKSARRRATAATAGGAGHSRDGGAGELEPVIASGQGGGT